MTKIPIILMEDLRCSLGLDSDEIIKDDIIFNMSKKEILERVLKFAGYNDIKADEILRLQQNQVDDYCDNNFLFGVEGQIKLVLLLN